MDTNTNTDLVLDFDVTGWPSFEQHMADHHPDLAVVLIDRSGPDVMASIVGTLDDLVDFITDRSVTDDHLFDQLVSQLTPWS